MLMSAEKAVLRTGTTEDGAASTGVKTGNGETFNTLYSNSIYWGCSDCVFHLCTGCLVPMYSICILGFSTCVFYLCTGGVVTVYSICVLGV